jgi:hypothetical protein
MTKIHRKSLDERMNDKNQDSSIKVQPIFDNNFKNLLDTRIEIHEKSLLNIEFSKPLISRGGIGIIYPNTITTIQAKKGSHKSRLAETIAILLLHHQSSFEIIGFSRDLPKPVLLLYVDTERNQKDQLPYAMQQIRLKAGYPKEKNPEIFDFISLITIPREERFKTLKNYIDKVVLKFKEHQLIIILDVVTDCVSNFNEASQSMLMVDLINVQCNVNDATFITVIHENPGGEKARGHLGTEIINKSSQVMQIGFDGDNRDLIVLRFLHSRNTKAIDPVYLKFDEKTKGLIEADADSIKNGISAKQDKAPLNQVEAWLKMHLIEETIKKEVYKGLMNHFDCGERTVDERLNTLVESEIIDRFKNGKNIFYKIKALF